MRIERKGGMQGRPVATAGGSRLRRVLPLTAGVALAAYAGFGLAAYLHDRPPAGLEVVEDFEGKGLDSWRSVGEVQGCCADSFRLVAQPVRSGAQALQVELRASDADVEGSRRAELRLPASWIGQDYWYAFSVFVPADWASDALPVTVAQWHGAPDHALLEGNRPPPLRLGIVEDRWVVGKAWDARFWSGLKIRPVAPQGGEVLLSTPLARGRWVDWRFHVRWSYREDGLVEAWKDGEPAFRSAGPNAYNDRFGPYFKIGIYVPGWTASGTLPDVPRRSLVIDRVRVMMAAAWDSVAPDIRGEVAGQ